MSTSPPPFASALPPLPNLTEELQSLLRQIPAQRVTTYGRLASALGSLTAAKWVASWLIDQPPTTDLPVHRVVRADGSLGEYRNRSSFQQLEALLAEGISQVAGQVNLNEYGFNNFQSSAPLEQLADWQVTLAKKISITTPPKLKRQIQAAIQLDRNVAEQGPPYCIAGVDVSYASPSQAVAAYALVDLHSGELVWSKTRHQAIDFPYISGFLALRELPALLPLFDEVRAEGKLADVIMVDGHGVLHPRRMGIASHLGVVTGLTTVGVGKTLSVGAVDLKGLAAGEARPIISDGQTIGTALRPTGGQKPLFFSPGHRIDLATANAIVCRLSQHQRLPTPTYWADRLSREAARSLNSSD